MAAEKPDTNTAKTSNCGVEAAELQASVVETELEHADPQDLIAAFLNGTFDENIRTHAESLAEKLIERQLELDRREAQLNKRTAELENEFRNLRLQSQTEPLKVDIVTDQQAEEPLPETDALDSNQELQPVSQSTNETDEVETVADDQLLLHRYDKYMDAQRAPSTKLMARLRKYLSVRANRESGGASKSHDKVADLDAETKHNGLLASVDSEAVVPTSVALSMDQLSQSATAVRRRSEEVDGMYDALTDVFSEMLRQQASMRRIVDNLPARNPKASSGGVVGAKTDLNRLTVELTKVGRDHFLLPMGSDDAA